MTAEEIRKQFNYMRSKNDQIAALITFASFHVTEALKTCGGSVSTEFSDEYGGDYGEQSTGGNYPVTNIV